MPSPSRLRSGRFSWRWVAWGVGILVFLFCGGSCAEVLLSAKVAETTTQTSGHLLQIQRAAMGYAVDHDDHFPPAPGWMDSLYPYLKTEEPFKRAGFQNKPNEYGFAMNSGLSQFSTSVVDPERTVLFFTSSKTERSAHGSRDILYVSDSVFYPGVVVTVDRAIHKPKPDDIWKPTKQTRPGD